VTGAASGIGRATVERMAEEGATLYCVDVDPDGSERTAKRAADLGAQARGRECDVGDPEQAEAAVQACVDGFGRIDALCNVAGIMRTGHAHALSLEDWDRVLRVNLTGTFLMCRAAIPYLLATRGNIVNTSSTAALGGLPWGAAYAASKGGVLSLTRALAVEYGKAGLRVNAVCPGAIETPMLARFEIPEGANRRLMARLMPLDQNRGPETVAAVIAMLASADGAHMNGASIRVDGGILA